MNASNVGSATAAPRAGMDLILSAIGSTVSDDPLQTGDSGIVRPIDILCLQEARSSADTAVPYAALLNQIYNTSRYAAGTLDGASTGSGTQVVVFNTEAVRLVGMSNVGSTAIDGMPRQVTRYRFRPAGYTSGDGDLFVYNLHSKAGNTTTDRARRLVESQAIRTDADALGANRNVIYLGDLNVYKSSEPMYAHLLAPGNAAAQDPISTPGDWSNDALFKTVHTQSPWSSARAAQTGFNGTGGGVDDRFDQQLLSAAMLSGTSGLEYADNSYNAFGNNGSHAFDAPIDSGTGASPQVLAALSGILDHLPIVADYLLRPNLNLAHPGDATLDLRTDITDFAALAGNFNTAGSWQQGDFTGDGMAGIEDFAILAGNFNTSAPAMRAANVPEPVGLVAVVCVLLFDRQRRRM